MTRRVLAAVTDLFFVAKMTEAVRHASGVELDFVSTFEELETKAAAGVDLVVLDLNDAKIEALLAIQKLRAQPLTASTSLLGFLSHVDVDLAERAKHAGCNRIVPRSRFSAKLVEILRGGAE